VEKLIFRKDLSAKNDMHGGGFGKQLKSLSRSVRV
jgi:hypothetical protein